MPEGDSIRRIAAAIRPHLEGKVLRKVRAEGTEHTALAGRRVDRVATYGKHLVIVVEGDTYIRTHLKMQGLWWRYARDAAPRPTGALWLETDDDVLTCTRATIEIRDHRDPRYGVVLGRLGPDVLADTLDELAILARARHRPDDTPIASLLLDQGVAAGIGNIFKCEALFAEQVSPARPLRDLDDTTLLALYRRARTQMQARLAGHPPAFAVYRRPGHPCPRCQTPISSAVLPGQQRRTYWCPRCQPTPL